MDNRLLKLLKVLRKRKTIIILVEVVTLLLLLFLRLKLGITRYFDIDEFAYLHWGYNLYLGERPFTDFLFLFPPLFLYTLLPFFIVLGRTVAVLIQIRIYIFVIFLLTVSILILIGRKLRNLTTGLLAAIVFVFLPIPSDKMIEIRPDLMALMFALLGMYLFTTGLENRKRKILFFAGASYAISIGFITKTVFFLLPVLGILWLTGYKAVTVNKINKLIKHVYIPLAAGFAIPALITFLIVLSYGNFRFAVYSMTKLASDTTKALGAKFYMRPDIFFYPNDTYYGFPGTNNLPYILNLVIYTAASLWAIKNFISSLSFPDNNKCLREFLVASSFFVNLIAFVKFYPLKHAQYLILLVPFIAYYFADLAESIRRYKYGKLLIILVLLLIGIAGKQTYDKKSRWDNKTTLAAVNKLLSTIPKDEAVFDLTGSSVFFRHGYYLCCLPYGQYEEALKFPIPNLEKALDSSRTKYIHTDFYGRLDVLPPLQAKYIKENFVPYFPDGSLLIKK